MKLNELSPAAGSTHVGKRKGRGPGTGNGKTGGRGHKGQKARSGGGVRVGFEGGQMPLVRRIPKRAALERFDNGAVVDEQMILDAGIVSKARYGIKILGNGELTKNLTVKVSAFSQSAKEKIEAAGGKAEVI